MIKVLILSILSLFAFIHSDPATEIDAYWEAVSHTVATGDFEGYADLYHEDAVLVNGISGTSYAIQEALEGWEQGFTDTKSGKMKAGVEFRFSQRLHNANTAHETGIFKYTSQIKGQEPQPIYVHFQGLLVKKKGQWLMMMEYQMSSATLVEWEAMGAD